MPTRHLLNVTSDPEAVGTRTVTVPLNRRPLAPVTPDRVRRLRKHLLESLRAERKVKRPERFATPPMPDPDGFAGVVTRTACALCKGWCCKGGGEHGYLDERTMTRVRGSRPDLEARAVIRLYVERVPAEGYAGSCIFHGPQGCTLDRTLRSGVCNSYFCSGLGQFVKGSDAEKVVVAATEGDQVRASQILMRRRPSRAVAS